MIRSALRLSLGGAGVRSIEYDRVQAFRLITGAALNRENVSFKLWSWSGEVDQPQLQEIDRFDYSLKLEGVTRVSLGGVAFQLHRLRYGRVLCSGIDRLMHLRAAGLWLSF